MVFFERCVKSVSLIGDSVDRTAETQEEIMGLPKEKKNIIIGFDLEL